MNDDSEIDYMHPNGKPPSEKRPANKSFDPRELESNISRQKNWLQETDGHHICSAECKKSHATSIKKT